MVYTVSTKKSFDKDLKKCKKRGFDLSKLNEIIRLLAQYGSLPAKYKPHKLSGIYEGCWNAILQEIGCSYGNKMIMN